jgi:hypothetical protein
MELKYSKNKIELEKELNSLDEFIIEFTSILNKRRLKYVIVSGYVAILFGRNRASEDVDIIIENLSSEGFDRLWNDIIDTNFECLNTMDKKSAYNEYLCSDLALRFSRKGVYLPNIEIKCPFEEMRTWTLNNRLKVVLNGHTLFISPMELQIPFKLHLGSKKDIEDAAYLYTVFKEKLNVVGMYYFVQKLKVEKAFNRYLKGA